MPLEDAVALAPKEAGHVVGEELAELARIELQHLVEPALESHETFVSESAAAARFPRRRASTRIA